jgi:Tfp pilus assembly protein PilO
MKAWWRQVPGGQKGILQGLGMVLGGLVLYVCWWNPLLEEIETLRGDLIQQDLEIQAFQKKIEPRREVTQQLEQLRKEIHVYYPNMAKEETFRPLRKDIVTLAEESGMILRLWKLEESLGPDDRSDRSLTVVIKVEGGFHQASKFLRGIEQFPWVRAFTAIRLARVPNPMGGAFISMDIRVLGLTPNNLEHVKRLLAT